MRPDERPPTVAGWIMLAATLLALWGTAVGLLYAVFCYQ